MKPKFILLISTAVAFVALAGIFFWYKERRGPIYIPTSPDLKNCIIEEIEPPTPYQKICLDQDYPVPATVYFQDGWKIVCCSKLDNN